MTTYRSCIKCLRSTCEKFFTGSGGWNSSTCTWNKLYKRGVLKSFSKFSDKHKKQPAGGALSKDVLRKFVKFTEKTSLPESNF